jgi:uncharacterized protein
MVKQVQSVNIKKALQYVLILLLIAACASTQTSTQQFANTDDMLLRGDYQAVIAQLESAKEKQYKAKDRVLYYLDLGMLHHYAGNYALSNEFLQKAEYAIEELFTAQISKIATSILLNDNALDYSGEDYEDIYLNIFKALNYIALGEEDAAFVEINRIDHKLNMLQDKYVEFGKQLEIAAAANATEGNPELNAEPESIKFHNDALARYLSVLIYAADREWDNAGIAVQKLREAWTSQRSLYPHSMPEVAYQPENYQNGSLSAIAFVGKSPIKNSATYYITTFDDYVNVASSEPVAFSENIPWPTKHGKHFKFSLPYMSRRGTEVGRIEILSNGQKIGELALLESMEDVAMEAFKVKAPLIYIKSVVRSIVKGLASERAKAEMNKAINDPLAAMLAGMVTDVAVDATENADLRISRFFPSKSFVGHVELAPGTYNITLRYLNRSNYELYRQNFANLEIRENRLNLLQASYLQ